MLKKRRKSKAENTRRGRPKGVPFREAGRLGALGCSLEDIIQGLDIPREALIPAAAARLRDVVARGNARFRLKLARVIERATKGSRRSATVLLAASRHHLGWGTAADTTAAQILLATEGAEGRLSFLLDKLAARAEPTPPAVETHAAIEVPAPVPTPAPMLPVTVAAPKAPPVPPWVTQQAPRPSVLIAAPIAVRASAPKPPMRADVWLTGERDISTGELDR